MRAQRTAASPPLTRAPAPPPPPPPPPPPKARLWRQLAPERERKAKLRRAERRRQRRLGEPEEDVAEEPRPDDYDSDAAYEAYLARIAANPPFARRCS